MLTCINGTLQVQLQQKIKQESEQFRAWKAAREKEVMQVYLIILFVAISQLTFFLMTWGLLDFTESCLALLVNELNNCHVSNISQATVFNMTSACRWSQSIWCTEPLSILYFNFDQLKKEGRRNEYEMHKLMALNQKQKLVSTFL